jgi:hypothetical protein
MDLPSKHFTFLSHNIGKEKEITHKFSKQVCMITIIGGTHLQC